MNDATIIEFAGRDTVSDPLTELLQTAVEAELDASLAKFANYRTPEGWAAVVRNGHHPERAVQTGIGPPASGRLGIAQGSPRPPQQLPATAARSCEADRSHDGASSMVDWLCRNDNPTRCTHSSLALGITVAMLR